MAILKDISPGSSSSSSTQQHVQRFDVFLSFRGVDTRNGFTDHLYNALLEADINTFLDDEEIDTGEPLKPELEGAIISSRAAIIVLSENYASSTWCLDELVLILEQKRDSKQIVIPVFYHVEPTDVRKQQNSFGNAMAKHKQKMDAETDVKKKSRWAQNMVLWKMALTEVADLKGKDAKNRKETEFIKEVVADVHRRLGALLSDSLPLLIGMDYEIETVSSWLTDGSSHIADILTVVGMGGIGKTTLAKYGFKLHRGKFQKSSFIEGINTKCNEHFNGLLELQKQLFEDISKKIPLNVNDVSVYTSKIENVVARKQMLIVLDDIDSPDQLDALLGKKGLHPGSKVIITTKNASLTEMCALFNPQVQPNHMKILLNGLGKTESLQLLCIHAFKSEKAKEGYKEVSEKLVEYCEGHPLALEVLGRSLHKRDVAYWEECIEGLKKEPNSRVKKALQMSFDSLPLKDNKELFKHVACFFVGMDRDLTETILNACDIKTRSGITNLTDRCLLRIRRNNQLVMHQLVQEMGRDLVRQESPNKPWKRSRLWSHEETFKVLKQNKSKENILGLSLDMKMLDKRKLRGSLELKTDSLSKMDNLMLLQLNYVQLKDFFEDVPEELRWLCMHGFPLMSINLDLPIENAVALDMSYSNIESFGMSYCNPQSPVDRRKQLIESCSKDKQLLGSLKVLDLSFCEALHTLGGFFKLPSLERLIVKNCINLLEMCESIEQCVKLVHIDLSYCYKLKALPVSMGKLNNVKTLLLDGCNFQQLQSYNTSLNSQPSSSAIVEAIPSDLKFFTISLPNSLRKLSLANNNLSIESFPMDLSSLSMLKELCLDQNPIVSMPDCVRTLPRLEKLSMQKCEVMISIEHPPLSLKTLSIGTRSFEYYSVRKVKFNPEMSELKFFGGSKLSSPSSFEIDGMVKIQPMNVVEENVLHALGWTDLDFIKERFLVTYLTGSDGSTKTQMFYEFGIFSIIFEGGRMPIWTSLKSKSSSISFIIPSSPKKLCGLNFWCVNMYQSGDVFFMPLIKVRNVTKDQTWIYQHYVAEFNLSRGACISLFSHWMFGPNEMEDGDQITINVVQRRYSGDLFTMECGVGLLYDERKTEDENDALHYYKSWNHRIGGDLSPFRLTTGEYLLDNIHFMNHAPTSPFHPFLVGGAHYKDDYMTSFKAFSH